MSAPTVYGVGVGPGAPDLMSVRAARLVGAAKVVAYFRKAGRPGHARRIADGLLADGVIEEPMDYPVTTEIALDDPAYAATLRSFYEQCVARLAEHIAQGRDVVVLCEGDPFLYGSFMHLHSRLAPRVPVEVVPGISGMAACWTASGTPITYGDDVLCVVPATLGPARLKAALAAGDAIVIMKLGRNLPKVRRALDDAGLLDRAIYVERGAMDDQVVMPLADKTTDDAPYFSIVLVHGQGRRP
ncbi:precorrin-2 C(20)-methyltransferase [Rhodopseudomonas sp. BR0G17]|uniref:precorrin-2 C(20)-methyltransferase n=1 Tax=Rhodopseudomonas sp. BR0G17 TaxID=2269368 RepID=UPI0013DED426|nr:precorrin-2 C(20)-methyltransferase [Rhodopseudomonas sp. BR0G17]NEW97514.1 precorrin-2 C(20)-methyltransferase [Rhodopseudomonas sp. BR0G17]